MQKIIFYTVVILITFITKVSAQEKSFEKQAGEIAKNIETITTEEKQALKIEVEAIEKQLEEGKITAEQAKEQKMKVAEQHAKNIETKVAQEQIKLEQLVQAKVDGKVIADTISKKKFGEVNLVFGVSTEDVDENETEINLSSMKVYKGKDDYIRKVSKRTTSQIVFATGLNNLITEGQSLEDSDYRMWGSHFYEWGLTLNSRILKNHNLLHAKYGLSFMYNNLRPTDNRYFVKNGNQTVLSTATIDLDESRFRNVYLALPVHLELDFSPKRVDDKGNEYFRTHKSFRLGLGGFGGLRVKSKQILKYDQDNLKVKDKQKGDFNVSNFTYGLSGYIGYRATSLYVKYDLNPMFKHNAVDQNNISFGVRFDIN